MTSYDMCLDLYHSPYQKLSVLRIYQPGPPPNGGGNLGMGIRATVPLLKVIEL